MNGDNPDNKDVAEEDLSEDETANIDPTETDILTGLNDDNIGDLSVELNVEELVAKLESADDSGVHRKSEIRRRLEEIREQRDQELDSTYNINIDEE